MKSYCPYTLVVQIRKDLALDSNGINFISNLFPVRKPI